jgi:hypothetical protein
MAWVPKINRHVTLLKRISASVVKPVPAVIIAFATDTNPIVRVGRHGQTFGSGAVGVPRRTNPDENITVTKYISY